MYSASWMCELCEELHKNGTEEKVIYIKTHSQILKARCEWYLWMYEQEIFMLTQWGQGF